MCIKNFQENIKYTQLKEIIKGKINLTELNKIIAAKITSKSIVTNNIMEVSGRLETEVFRFNN
jgi:hypothetical protein